MEKTSGRASQRIYDDTDNCILTSETVSSPGSCQSKTWEENLAQAIGKGGQNVKLASELTGWN